MKPRHQPSERDQQAREKLRQKAKIKSRAYIQLYPSMLTNKQVPVLNLTETSITSQADLQDAFQSLCLCSHGRKESTEDKSAK